MVIIPNDSLTPNYVDIEYPPLRGALVKNDSELIVGCVDGHLTLYSLADPTNPLAVKTIKVSKSIWSLLKINDNTLLCG
jgi:hypothetical protein